MFARELGVTVTYVVDLRRAIESSVSRQMYPDTSSSIGR